MHRMIVAPKLEAPKNWCTERMRHRNSEYRNFDSVTKSQDRILPVCQTLKMPQKQNTKGSKCQEGKRPESRIPKFIMLKSKCQLILRKVINHIGKTGWHEKNKSIIKSEMSSFGRIVSPDTSILRKLFSNHSVNHGQVCFRWCLCCYGWYFALANLIVGEIDLVKWLFGELASWHFAPSAFLTVGRMF